MNDDWEEMREEDGGHDGAAKQRAEERSVDGLAAAGNTTDTGAGGAELLHADDTLPLAVTPPGSFPASARDLGDGTRPSYDTVALTPRTPLPPSVRPRPTAPWIRPRERGDPSEGHARSEGSERGGRAVFG
jgi:hypothetical protein